MFCRSSCEPLGNIWGACGRRGGRNDGRVMFGWGNITCVTAVCAHLFSFSACGTFDRNQVKLPFNMFFPSLNLIPISRSFHK